MNLNDARHLAITLMGYHGLGSWTFDFDNAKVRFGCCWYRKRKITLSRELTKLNSEAWVTETILHEIAHALVGPEHGHNRRWQRTAQFIGCTGNRCYDAKFITQPLPNYLVWCPQCGVMTTRYRRPKRGACCGRCWHRSRSLVDLIITKLAT